jgi:hypothetical protein
MFLLIVIMAIMAIIFIKMDFIFRLKSKSKVINFINVNFVKVIILKVLRLIKN